MADTVNTFTTVGPPVTSGDLPTLADVLAAAQVQVTLAKAAAAEAAASALASANSAAAAEAAPVFTTVIGAPVLSVFGRIGSVIGAIGDYNFSMLSGSVLPAQMPALTGAVVTAPGSTQTSFANIPNDTAIAGGLLFTQAAQPATPTTGTTRLYVDSTSKAPSAVNDAGALFAMPKVASVPSGSYVTGVGADGAWTYAAPATSNFSTLSGSASMAQLPTNANLASIEFILSGSGAPIPTGMQGWIQIPFPCTITSVSLFADQSGSIIADIWKCTQAQYQPLIHPYAGDSICASHLPTINNTYKSTDSTLSWWT